MTYNDCDCVPGHRCDCWDYRARPAVPEALDYGEARETLTTSEMRERTTNAVVATERELRAEAEAALALANEELAGAEQWLSDAVTGVLTVHYVTAIDCDHEAKTDTVRCNCSVWSGTQQPSVGDAVQEWIAHVIEWLFVKEPSDAE